METKYLREFDKSTRRENKFLWQEQSLSVTEV